jgi:hypothetical protein
VSTTVSPFRYMPPAYRDYDSLENRQSFGDNPSMESEPSTPIAIEVGQPASTYPTILRNQYVARNVFGVCRYQPYAWERPRNRQFLPQR